MKNIIWLIESLLYILVSIPFAVLPLTISRKFGETLGMLFFYVWRSRRKIALENLREAIASGAVSNKIDTEQIIKNNFKNYGRSIAEIIRVYYGLGRRMIEEIQIEGLEHYQRAKEKGRGAIFITGHCGNWELLPLAASFKVENISVVARPINNPYINKIIERSRQSYGSSVIYKKGALKEIISCLRRGSCVGILMDQAVLSDEGFLIEFLNRKAWTTKMPALIARKTGTAVIPAFICRADKSHRIKVYPEIHLSENRDKEQALIEDTRKFSSCIEEYIKENPSEWLWIHRRWKRAD